MAVFKQPYQVSAFKVEKVVPRADTNELTLTLVGEIAATVSVNPGDYVVLINGALTIEPAATFNAKYWDNNANRVLSTAEPTPANDQHTADNSVVKETEAPNTTEEKVEWNKEGLLSESTADTFIDKE